ncbi:uncharacterized protein PV06_09336 [Exophiala oligosperma]|uniref:Major facilitator superfamily (MFS) profile domain-containing protein n=1 Tax=Exophiala oligosperma TaxID=215243 RepID=A0A0D2D577_9EURO|nr:uncharacterized protein PV06_09336 [Exophiala oligosperma]KIW38363.1 hypothetical protein PV06_09336 [Exophiala oligosperma]
MADTQEPTQPPDSDSIQTTTNNPLSLIEKDQQQLEEKSIDVDSDGPNHTPQRVSIEKPTDWSQYTLKRRPWRPCVTDFSRIIEAKYRGSGTPSDPYIVQWLDDDPCNPKTYSMKRKTILSALLAFMTLCISLASSAYTGPSESIMEEFHCSEEIFLLGLTFFVLGFGTGPLVFGPLSEALGRRNILMLSMIFYTIWTGICIAAQNIQSLIVFRALAGTIGSAAFVIPGGQIADMFDAEQRGVVIAIYSAAPFLGPTLGPMIGGFIDLGASWRWLFGVLTLYSGALTFFGLLIVPETYAPVLLRQRAKLLTKVTGKTHMTKIDIDNPLTFHKMVRKSLVLPWALLFREPIVLLLTIYTAVIYGTLYLCFAAYPIVFQEGHGWNAGVGGLAFIGMLVGIFVGVAIIIYDNRRYIRIHRETGGFAPPETRLPTVILGGVIAIVGLAWFAATTSPSVHWIVPILAGVPFGAGFLLIFMSCMNYLIDSYVIYAASVMAANSVLRSAFGAVFPLFTVQMYENLGVHWASAVPGFIALACFPFPIFFYKYGRVIRRKCKYSAQAAWYLDSLKSDLERQRSRGEANDPDSTSVKDNDDAV